MKAGFVIGCIGVVQAAQLQSYSGYGNHYNAYSYKGNGYGSSYGHSNTQPSYQGSYVAFNVPRTQQIYFHHNHRNDQLYGYDSVPRQNNYNTALNTAIFDALTVDSDGAGALTTGALDQANASRTAYITTLATEATNRLNAIQA